ncbi:hypothetical protein [Maribellus sediminis]|nr:hypothetical protein [Maribellus sediminis]
MLKWLAKIKDGISALNDKKESLADYVVFLVTRDFYFYIRYHFLKTGV